MKYFLKMIEVFNDRKILNFEQEALKLKNIEMSDFIKNGNEEAFIDFAKSCRPFVFTPINDGPPTEYPKKLNEIEDAPFECFSIELTGDRPIPSPNPLDSMIDFEKRTAPIEIWAMMVCEFAPKEFIVYFLVKVSNTNNWVVVVIGNSELEANGLIQHYIDRISKEKSGLEIVNVKQKIGTGKQKIFHKIKSVIHITGSPSRYSGSYGSREVDWTHRFEVRGHWRKVSGIGKDRQGNYGTEGFTWIESYVKGSEELPLIKKQRIVQNDGRGNQG